MINKRIILTGASGTLGYNLAEQLSAMPQVTVRALHRLNSRGRTLPTSIELECVDFHNKSALQNVFERFQPDIVIHCAASGTQLPKPNWFELARFNIDVTLDLCECASLVNNCHFVYVSTGLAYRDQGRPLTEHDPLDTLHPYGASKAAADLLVRSAVTEFGVPLTVVRPFSFTGPADDGNRLFPSLLRAAVEQRPLDLSPGDQVRDHCAVQDIAAGIITAARLQHTHPTPLRVYNLGSGSTTPLRQLIESVTDELNLSVRLNFGARDYARFEPRFMVADTTLAQSALNWIPRTSVAHAVWELAQHSFPSLQLRQPKR